MTSRPEPRQPPVSPAPPFRRAVILIGFMASGKTSVGKALSRILGWSFYDLDEFIQHCEGRSIPEIFRVSGEAAFRRAEVNALTTLLKKLSFSSPGVIALGGGAFIQPGIRELLCDDGIEVVWLDAPPEELWQRCSLDPTERPLARDLNQFRQLYEERRRHYTEAGLRLGTSGREIDRIAEELIERLRLNGDPKEK